MSESLIKNRTHSSAQSFTDSIYYRPLVPLLIAFMTGLTCANYMPALTRHICAGIFVSAGMIIYSICRHKNATLSPLLLFFFLGYYALAPWISPSFSQGHVAFYVNNQRQWKISGIIDDTPMPQDFRTVCILNHIRLSPPNCDEPPIAVQGKIRAIIYGKTNPMAIGDRLIFTSKIRAFTNFKNPGGFDYIKYMAFKQIWGNAYTASKKLTIEPLPNNFQKSLSLAREKISALINQSSGDNARAILNALLLGNRQQISKPLRQAFNRAGISHILAISGLHIGIVASFAFLLSTWLLSRFKPFLQHAWTRKGAAILSFVPIMIYGIMAGMSPSTQRAVIMVGVFLLTFLIGRKHDLINTLSIAALIILIIAPPALFSVSFQLSFAAVLSIIYGISRVFQSKKKPENLASRLLKTLITFIIVSGLAIMGTAPLTLFYFNQISFAGIFSNLIFVPLIGFAVVPVGLFSVLILLPISSNAAFWGLRICDAILTFSIDWIYKIASLPYAAVKTITPSIIEITCVYIVLGTVLYLLFPLKMNGQEIVNSPEKTDTTRSFKQRLAFTFLAIALLGLSVDIIYWIQKRWVKDDLTISIVDVGQGNAALLEMPGGQCALIDGGGYSNNSIFDIGEKVLAPFLWRKKIKTIETLFLTHYDADHLNGLIYILKHFNVKQIFANHDPSTCLKNNDFVDAIHEKQIKYPSYKNLSKEINLKRVAFKIFYPLKNFADLASKESWRDSNNNSMVIQVNFGSYSILFPGDIMKKAEQELIHLNYDLHSTIMLAPHHGSISSSTQEFLKQVNPKYIIISSGWQNRFGFPSPKVLARYEMNKISIFRTDINGEITITCDGRHLSLTPLIGKKMSSGQRPN